MNALVHADSKRGNHKYASFSDLWIVVASGVVIHFWATLTESITSEYFRSIVKGADSQNKKHNLAKATRYCFQTQYFFVSAVWGYLVLQPTQWLPWQLGGSGTIEEAFERQISKFDKFPFTKCPRQVEVYMLATMGYHCYGIVRDCVNEKTSDFYEMLLHHIATCSLYFCSIFGNGLSIGSVIAYLHDIADIFVGVVKTLSTTDREFSTLLAFVSVLVTWLWTRLVVLPQMLMLIY
jgi:ceramide synthetase